MSLVRLIVEDQGLARRARAGDNYATSRLLTVVATDANATLTADRIAGGLVQFTGFTAGRTITTDTAVNIIAANLQMDVGDSFEVHTSISTAFAGTMSAGTGVTLAGKTTIAASGHLLLLFTRTGAATVTCTGL